MTTIAEITETQANAQKLLKAINESKGGQECFCNDIWREPVGDSIFTFKFPSTCGGCIRAISFLESFEPDWRSVPYVQRDGGREYSIKYAILEIFATRGVAGYKEWQEARELEAAQAKRLKLLAERKAESEYRKKVISKAGGVPREALPQMQNYLQKQDKLSSLYIAGPDLAAWFTDDSFNTGAGMSYSHILHVYIRGSKIEIKLQWRDGRSAKNDDPSNHINKILGVDESVSKVFVKVDTRAGMRTVELKKPALKPIAEGTSASLSMDEQFAFIMQVQDAIATTMREKQERHQRQPEFYDGIAYVPYQTPELMWVEYDEMHGLAAWAFCEQIDAHPKDRQMRIEVYVLRHGCKPVLVHEVHGFESEGRLSAKFEEFKQKAVVLRTPEGLVTRPYKQA